MTSIYIFIMEELSIKQYFSYVVWSWTNLVRCCQSQKHPVLSTHSQSDWGEGRGKRGRELHDHWVKWANKANVFATVMFSDKVMTRTMSIWNTDSTFLRVGHLDMHCTHHIGLQLCPPCWSLLLFHVQETSSLYGARAVSQILRQRASRETIVE